MIARIVAPLALAALFSGCRGPTPTGDRFERARAAVLPNSAELAWEAIPWHSSYSAGVQAAARTNKPLLFWAMNGHPLGCT